MLKSTILNSKPNNTESIAKGNHRIFAFTLVVPDYDDAIAFYVGKLGFHLVEDVPISSTKRWVVIAPDLEGTAILLAKAASAQQRTAIGNQTGGRVGFFLQTDNFETSYREMIANAITFEELPRDESYGRVAVWRDPFGNRWDLIRFGARDMPDMKGD